MDDEHFLTSFFDKQKFTKTELETIISKFKPIQFSKNDFLLLAGKTANHYWIMQNGLVRSYVIDPEGNDISTNFFSGGEIVIDWPSFFLRQPTRENIQALADCMCWQLDFGTFQILFNQIEAFREQGRARLVTSYFELKKYSISMIADGAKDRYLKLLKEKPHILQHVSLKQIATYLGVTDTSLSRIRKEVAHE
jgi:CRP-like cAMP-binding protein